MKTIAGVLFLILLFPLSSSALPIIQDEGIDGTTIGLKNALNEDLIVGQSFVPDESIVGFIGAFIRSANIIPGDDLKFTMSIFSGDGDFVSRPPLITKELLGPAVGVEDYIFLDVRSVPFKAGESYTLALTDDNPKWEALINRGLPDVYNMGTAYEESIRKSNDDLRFRVLADQKPIPEPATILLLGAGLVGLAGFGRKKFRKE